MTATKLVTCKDSRRCCKAGSDMRTGSFWRIAAEADMDGLASERVLGAATILLHQTFGHEAGQIAMHLGRAFIDGSSDGREIWHARPARPEP
jgi:hypothetical protein